MFGSRLRRLLIPAVTSLVVLASASPAAAAPRSRPLPPCAPPAFTGSVGAHSSQCVKKPSARRAPRGRRGRRGLRGVTGRTGAAGRTGATGHIGKTGAAGRTGATGHIGLTGAAGPRGQTGSTGLTGAAGTNGIDGAAGTNGTDGAAGTNGTDGAAGTNGTDGAAGADGTDGTDGAAGADGTNGVDGLRGVQGETGAPGADGTNGVDGAPGAQGETGSAGPPGPAGSSGLSEYAYIYNEGAQTVAQGAAVTFDSNGVMTTGITHAAGSGGIALVSAGTYKVSFSVSGTEPSQMALFRNGTVIPGSVYGSGAGTQQNTGQVIVTVGAGDVLTLRNHTSSAAVGLQTLAGGTQQNANASVAIEKIA